MNAESIAPVIKACLAQMQTKLEDARQIARAAEACAEAGRLDQAAEVSMILSNSFMMQTDFTMPSRCSAEWLRRIGSTEQIHFAGATAGLASF